MGTTQLERSATIQFKVSFNAALLPLFNNYKAIIMFLKTSGIFAQKSAKLEQLVKAYIKDPINYNKSDLALCAIDSTRKLYHVSSQNESVYLEEFISACLRHHSFVMEYHWQDLHFQESFRRYHQFLYLCYNQPGDVIIPSKKERFIWNAHRQDTKGYQEDMLKLFNHLLEGDDRLSPEEIEKCKKKTKEFRKFYLPAFRKNKNSQRKEHQLKEESISSDS